jgi:hypothetical protein
MTYTPDTLREEAENLRTDTMGLGYSVRLGLHADAWAADRKDRDGAEDICRRLFSNNAALRKDIEAEALAHQGTIESWMAESKAMHDEYAALRKRLEEAERYHNRYAEHIRFWIGKDRDEDARQFALAGEEKPCPGCGVVGVNVHTLGCRVAALEEKP